MITFPDNPVEGQEETIAGRDWIYAGGRWRLSGIIRQTLINGDTSHVPSVDVVYDALAAKVSVAEVSDSNVGSTIAKRTSSGDIQTRLFRSEFADQSTISGALAYRVNSGADNFLRFCNDATAIREFSGAPTWNPTIAGVNNNYTLVAADRHRIVGKTNNTAYTYTVDPAQLVVGGFYYVSNFGALADITLTPSATAIMRLTGTATVGNRTLAPRALARIWVRSAGEVWVDGPGVT